MVTWQMMSGNGLGLKVQLKTPDPEDEVLQSTPRYGINNH
jgi:hypothetical protein